ncbi:hypothetical protein QR680_002187 [Steinernema hermaphroditum]|uniref:Myosin tail domain-containing protein n=1 Tax=Steinernema hermaphroditum TaxID=289476 RepID=A0AA39H2K3_9BILA|nr:hypothetical protein QR680_002187 [Steinernema hermaphroditum]
MEQQLELANRLKEEYYKQLKKTQMIVKECQQDADEARQAKENVVKYRKMQQNREDEKRALEASNRELRRKITEMEKKLADVTMLLEEERKNTENFQWQLERKNTRNRFLRRELDAAEEEASRERSKVRKLQREVEDLTEANEAFLRLTSMRM